VNLQQAALAAAATSGEEMRRAYRRAVWQGAANTQCSAEQERAYGALRLLTLATLRLPDLVLYAHLAHACEEELRERGEDGPQRTSVLVLAAVADRATGALRLTHRALQTHGRELGYAVGAWVECALDRTREQLDARSPTATGGNGDELELGVTLEQAKLATVALTRATAATAGDPMLVADQIAHGLGHLFAVCLIAREAGG
jgi:hypothetical protein